MIQSNAVAIFWDYENCPLPRNFLVRHLVNTLRSLFEEYGWVTQFNAYSECFSSVSHSLRRELQHSGVSLVDCPHNGRANTVDTTMIVDMMAFALDFPAQATIVLIAGDRGVDQAISLLHQRGYNVVTILPAGSRLPIGVISHTSVCLDWTADVLNKMEPGNAHAHAKTHTLLLSPPASDSEFEESDLEDVKPVAAMSPLSLKSIVSQDAIEQPELLSTPPPTPLFPSFMPSPLLNDQSYPQEFRFLAKKLAAHHRKGITRPQLSQIASDVTTDRFCYERSAFDDFDDLKTKAVKAGAVVVGSDEHGQFMAIHPQWSQSFAVSDEPVPWG